MFKINSYSQLAKCYRVREREGGGEGERGGEEQKSF